MYMYCCELTICIYICVCVFVHIRADKFEKSTKAATFKELNFLSFLEICSLEMFCISVLWVVCVSGSWKDFPQHIYR